MFFVEVKGVILNLEKVLRIEVFRDLLVIHFVDGLVPVDGEDAKNILEVVRRTELYTGFVSQA